MKEKEFIEKVTALNYIVEDTRVIRIKASVSVILNRRIGVRIVVSVRIQLKG